MSTFSRRLSLRISQLALIWLVVQLVSISCNGYKPPLTPNPVTVPPEVPKLRVITPGTSLPSTPKPNPSSPSATPPPPAVGGQRNSPLEPTPAPPITLIPTTTPFPTTIPAPASTTPPPTASNPLGVSVYVSDPQCIGQSQVRIQIRLDASGADGRYSYVPKQNFPHTYAAGYSETVDIEVHSDGQHWYGQIELPPVTCR